MRLKCLLSLACVLFVTLLFANTDKKGQLVGKVQDTLGNGLPFVSIEIYTKGEVQDLISGGMTDESGGFQVDDIPYGTYEMVVSAVGFSDKVQDIDINSPVNDLGTIVLGGEIVTLEGAEIRGEVSQYRTEID